MALTKTQVSELYVAIFNRASEGEGNQFWQGAESVAAAAADMLASAPAQEYFGSALDSNQAFIEHIYLNTFNKTVADDASGIQFWVDALEAGASRGEIVAGIVQAATDPANAGAAQDQFLNRVAVSNYTADNLDSVDLATQEDAVRFDRDLTVTADDSTVDSAKAAIDEVADGGNGGGDTGEPGETIMLTDGRDALTGTENADTFVGYVGQNQNGAVANEFATGDRVDGGAGRDKIEASMIADNETDGFGNAQAPRPYTQNVEEVYIEALEDVTLDATRMENVEQFWADFGRGDFTVNNVNLQGSNLNITKDVTFGIRDTQFGTDFTATFDSQSLLAAPEEAANSQLQIQVADVSTQTPETPLANVALTLGFELGGESYVLENVVSTNGTYQGLVIALEAAFEDAGLGNLNVALSEPYTQVTVGPNTVNLPFTAQEILVTDPDGNTFGQVDFTPSNLNPVPGGFIIAGTAEPVDPTVSGNLIETNLVLDNAGRGSTAGDVQIGGESNSEIGVERFNVTVDRGSKIASLTETGTNSDELEEIYIGSTGANGSLFIGAVDSDLNLINASAFEGASLAIGTPGTAVSDLVSFDSSGSDTNVALVADYDGNGRASEAQAFTINTGAGNDSITADLTGTSTSTSTTASLTVNSTGGNNVVTLSSTDAEVNEATVVLGSGSDVVTGGATHLTVDTNAGNDVVYAENTGNKAQAQLAANSAFAAAGAGTATAVSGVEVLNGRTVQVTVAMPEEIPTVAADSFVDGYEVTAQIQASDGVLTTERDLYEAAARAINEDPVVNKLVQASVDSLGNLNIQYLVDGETAALENLVQLEVLGEWADVSSSEKSSVLAALQAKYQDSTISDTDVGNLYDRVFNNDEDFAQAFAGVPSEFNVDLATLTATATAGGQLTFTIDGQSVTLTEGVDFTGQATADALAAELEANVGTVVIDGVTYNIAQAGVGSTDINLTTATGAEVIGTVSATSTEGGVTTVNGTQTTVGVDGALGTDSATDGVNTVNGGAGNDVIVLSSNDATIDTLVFDQGAFGNDTVVHFNEGAGGDVLDFSAWLNNVTDASVNTNSLSEQRVDGTAALIGAMVENSVAVTDFTALDTASAVNLDFGSMTNAQVLAALNEAGGYQSGAAAATLVGTVQKSILMVENVDNLGEYKVYEVTSEAAAGDNFTAATLVGSVDFGDTLNALDDTNVA